MTHIQLAYWNSFYMKKQTQNQQFSVHHVRCPGTACKMDSSSLGTHCRLEQDATNIMQGGGVRITAAAPARKGEDVVRSPKNMATAKIAAVDFIDLY